MTAKMTMIAVIQMTFINNYGGFRDHNHLDSDDDGSDESYSNDIAMITTIISLIMINNINDHIDTFHICDSCLA